MQKDDALAVIDLAEACDMFMEERPINYKAAGICFNNIGNIQFKTEKYDQAAENFSQAVEAARQCAGTLKNERLRLFEQREPRASRRQTMQQAKDALLRDDDWLYYNRVGAHRLYLLAMSAYKHLRFEGSPFTKSKWVSFLGITDSEEEQFLTQNQWFNLD